MQDNYGIKGKPAINHKPQANAIVDRSHKVVNCMLRSFVLEMNNENLEELDDISFEYFLQYAAWKMQIGSAFQTNLQQ
jgi:hypothetical protein